MAKSYGMEGNIYGRLLVLKEDAGRNKNQLVLSLCECQCEAHTQFLVPRTDIRRGHTKSCGCLQKEAIAKINYKNETGNKYNMLTVLYRTNKKGNNGQYYWMCQCDCGNKKIIRGDLLRNGSVKSCGCLAHNNRLNNKKYYPGAKFGFIELLEPLNTTDAYNYAQWKCKCWVCGKNFITSTKRLNQGQKACCITNSLGEEIIKDLLNKNNIEFISQYTSHSCKFPDTNVVARFDFYIPNDNYIIEFDGAQHFIQSTGIYNNPQQFQYTQEHDKIKNEWCKINNIPLIRIPYWHIDELNIKDLLLETTEFLI